MRITDKTKYRDFLPAEPFLKSEGIESIKKAAEARYGAIIDLEFGSFYNCVNGDYTEILGDAKSPTVLQVYWARRFKEFTEEFARMLKKLEIKQTADEKRAATGLLKTDWGEGMLVFLQQFFGLRSFREAEKITIGEILIAKRTVYNREMYQRKIADIRISKMRLKK